MEQLRQVGEVLGSLKAVMVLKHEISINQRQCSLLYDLLQLAFHTISEEIKQNLRLDEKNTKWKALELPLKELYRIFKDVDCYIRYCMDIKDWWGKAISLHMNRDCVELHIHNLLSCFSVVIEAIETAAEISGVNQEEMQKKRTTLMEKYDDECDDFKLFLWKYGKQYLVPREICSRLETAWREDKWLLYERVGEKKMTGAAKNEQRLAELLLKKLTDGEASNGKIMTSNILVGAPDYQVRRRLGAGYPSGGSHLKEIHWLGESFGLRTFYGDIGPLLPEIYSLLSLSHPNVLQYLCAFYDEGRKEGFLVMELMSKDLGSYIKEHGGQRNRIPFSIPVAVDIMLQIARGLEYLHSKQIYHGDLNPSNILLKANNPSVGGFQAKVTGFGMTAIKSCASRSPKQGGSVDIDIWLAPEVLEELEQPRGKCTKFYSEKADVYSFGMLCFELLTGKVPFEDGHLQGEQMVRNIRAGERPLFPYPAPKYLVVLTKKCWQTNPDSRPTFSSICRILRYIKKILVINPYHGCSECPPPLVDYCDIEAGYLKKFPIEGSGNVAPVTQIPFQMFAYKVVEKEKISSKKEDSPNEALGLPQISIFEDDQLAAMDDLFLVPGDQRSVCSEIIDSKSATIAEDLRTVISEGPHRKLFHSLSLGSESPHNRLSSAPADTERKNALVMDQKSNNIQSLENKGEVPTKAITAPQENGKKVKLENIEVPEKKPLRAIVDQKPACSEGKLSALRTENKRLADIPEKKTLQNEESFQKMVSVSSERKKESTAKSTGKSGNSDKKPMLNKKMKDIKNIQIPEMLHNDSPESSPARMKKAMSSFSPASSPARTFKKYDYMESPKHDLLKSSSTRVKTTTLSYSPASSPSRTFKKSGRSESPSHAGMKIEVPSYSPASSPLRDFKKYDNSETPARTKKQVISYSPASSPSRATHICASPNHHASAYYPKEYPSPISSPMDPSVRSRLGRQTSLPLNMSPQRRNIDRVHLR